MYFGGGRPQNVDDGVLKIESTCRAGTRQAAGVRGDGAIINEKEYTRGPRASEAPASTGGELQRRLQRLRNDATHKRGTGFKNIRGNARKDKDCVRNGPRNGA